MAFRAMGASACAAAALGGCTIVEVHGPAGVRTSAHLGTLRIVADAPGLVAYRSIGWGLVPGVHGATLGVAAETAAFVPDAAACRLILFAPRRRDAEQLARLLAPVVRDRDICSTEGE